MEGSDKWSERVQMKINVVFERFKYALHVLAIGNAIKEMRILLPQNGD